MDTLVGRVAVLVLTLGLVESKMVDLTHPLNSSATHPSIFRDFNLSVTLNETWNGVWFLANDLLMAEHTGTHVDAPVHTWFGGSFINQIPLDKLVSLAVVISITDKATDNRDAMLSIQDIQNFETKYGRIPDRCLVILDTGGYKVYWDKVAFLGTSTPEDGASMHFPGFSPESMDWLIRERNINGVATDRMSIDPGNSTHLEAHVVMARNGRYGVENINNLHLLPPVGATVAVMVLPIQTGSGSPARVVGYLDGGNIIGGEQLFAATSGSATLTWLHYCLMMSLFCTVFLY